MKNSKNPIFYFKSMTFLTLNETMVIITFFIYRVNTINSSLTIIRVIEILKLMFMRGTTVLN